MLRSIGAEVVADEVGQLAAGLERVVTLNTAVCRPYYNAIVHAAAAEVRLRPRLTLHVALETCGRLRRSNRNIGVVLSCNVLVHISSQSGSFTKAV